MHVKAFPKYCSQRKGGTVGDLDPSDIIHEKKEKQACNKKQALAFTLLSNSSRKFDLEATPFMKPRFMHVIQLSKKLSFIALKWPS